jgi:hypothetical protein
MKTIIEMAREAGFSTHHEMIWVDTWEVNPYMQRFAALVRADEREACATVCDKQAEGAYWEGADACAELIRARGQA